MIRKRICFGLCLFLFAFGTKAQKNNMAAFYHQWCAEYNALQLPPTTLDYHENLRAVSPRDSLQIQENFFAKQIKLLKRLKNELQNASDSILYRHMEFECLQNLERIGLQKKWLRTGKEIPVGGLYHMKNGRKWYAYYVKHFTGLMVTPEIVIETGKHEVKRALKKIDSLNQLLGFKNDSDVLKVLQDKKFYLTDKEQIIRLFHKTDSTVRINLSRCFYDYNLPAIEAMEWPEGTVATPPGMYLNRDDNPYRKDVFLFNFSQNKFNTRCTDWLYMHEAIPGHHLQHYAVPDSSNFFYFGTMEGWACYAENLGSEMGLYQNPYTYLGMQEWNLVRSARLVMEVGIHYYGWSFNDALQYWKQNIKGQDAICEREIKRITSWPGQALCYKMGALAIQKLVSAKIHAGQNIRQIHHYILSHSHYPLYALCSDC